MTECDYCHREVRTIKRNVPNNRAYVMTANCCLRCFHSNIREMLDDCRINLEYAMEMLHEADKLE